MWGPLGSVFGSVFGSFGGLFGGVLLEGPLEGPLPVVWKGVIGKESVERGPLERGLL